MFQTTTLSCCLSLLLCARCLAQPYTDLSAPAEPWKDAPVGLTEQVPAPFTPLAVTDSEVACWGRSYSLAAPFPAAIRSQDQDLLAAPIRLVIRSGGQETVLAGKPVSMDVISDARIEFSTRLEAGPIRLRTPGFMEYDGTLGIDLEVDADGAELEYLAVEIPLRPEIARFFFFHGQWQDFGYHAVGQDPQWEFATPWQPNWWIGDHHRGLTVISETPGGWTADVPRAFVLSRTRDAVVLTATIISQPVAFDTPRRYLIGLQATPGKPFPKNAHNRHVGPADSNPTADYAQELLREKGINVALLWHDSARFFSYPEPRDPDAFRQAVKTYHEAGITCLYYITLSGTGLLSGVMQRDHNEWLMTGADGKALFGQNAKDPDLATAKSGDWASVCPASSYTDWLVWAVDRVMQEYDLDGVYIDNPGPYYCSNTAHGCGTRGERRHPYFANRELHQRLWNVVHHHKPETGLVWEHNSRTSNSFNLTFCDIYSDGEHMRVKSRGRPEMVTRALMDVSFSGRQWGAQPAFLCSALNQREEYTTWLLARVLPYGNHLFANANWMDFSAYSPVLQARHEFAIGDDGVDWYTPDSLPAWFRPTPNGTSAVIRTIPGDMRLELFAEQAADQVAWFTESARRGRLQNATGLSFAATADGTLIQAVCPAAATPPTADSEEVLPTHLAAGEVALVRSPTAPERVMLVVAAEKDAPLPQGSRGKVFARVTWGMHSVKRIVQAHANAAAGAPTGTTVVQQVDTAEILCGVFVRPGQNALVTLGNIGPEATLCRIPARSLEGEFAAGATLRDAVTGARLHPLGASYAVSIPAHSFRMIRIERAEP